MTDRMATFEEAISPDGTPRAAIGELVTANDSEGSLPGSANDESTSDLRPERGKKRSRRNTETSGSCKTTLIDLGTVCLADVAPEQVEWLWPGRIPLGKLTILEGDPKVGKSTLSLEVAARVTTGTPFPDEYVPQIGSVLVMTAEDGLADTVRPRLDAAGADVSRVIAWESVLIYDSEGNPSGIRPPSIPGDVDALETLIVGHDIALVIVDVLNAYLGRSVDGHRDQDVRRALMPLSKLAERTDTAIVVLRHLNKSAGGSPLYRGGGSIGIAGAARSILLAAVDPDNQERRVLVSQGGNVAAPPDAIAYELVTDPEHSCARVRWLGISNHTSASLLAVTSYHERSALADAKEWLGDYLADGPKPANEVKSEGRAAGHSWATLLRTKDGLHVRSEKSGMGGGWVWRLPAPDGARPTTGEHLEHLRHDQG